MKTKILLITTFLLLTVPLIISHASERNSLEYDPGAPKESLWPDLFAETPNYRLFGKNIIGGFGEKFRWNIGPMFYRGRLTPNNVKVFIVGQEGAQDENLSNRSFTGSTGTRMQKFLNYLGINKSYLFMNTFVYTITGQYSLYGEDAKDEAKKEQNKKLKWLAQNSNSIIVKHRHKMFNYMLDTNKETLQLIIGVGTAGKESVVTWLNSHKEGTCSYRKLTRDHCLGKGKLNNIMAIGLRHPGAASARNAGSTASGGLIGDFKKKANIVATKIKGNANFLPKDHGANRNFTKDFRYGYASIPHSDFAFGTPWTLGQKGTTSNRRGKTTIQIYSSNGCYNNGARINGRCKTIPPDERPLENEPDPRLHYLYYKTPNQVWNKTTRPSNFDLGDLPYESPRSKTLRREYDEGPKEYTKELLNYFNETLVHKDKLIQSPSFGHTGIYRGRFKNISILLLTDQQDYTDMFSGRALTGLVGQKLRPFFSTFAKETDYLILRTLPMDCLSLDKNTCLSIMESPNVTKARDKIIYKLLKNNEIKVLLTLGEGAKKIAKSGPLSKIPTINLSVENILNKADLEKTFAHLHTNYISPNSLTVPKIRFDSSEEYIPRKDLPFQTRWWMGTSGNLVQQAKEKEVLSVRNHRIARYKIGQPNGDYYKLYAPSWNNSWSVSKKPLTIEESESINIFKEQWPQ